MEGLPEKEPKNEIKLGETAEKLKGNLISFFKTLESVEKDRLLKALDLALDLHSDQKDRTDGAYVNHILRVANRIVTDFQIRNVAIISASLLHDSVEDQSKKLSRLFSNTNENEQKNALAYIKENFGEETAQIVSAVTNSEELENLESEERNRKYAEHITDVIQNPRVFYVKFSDFSDNGLNIENVTDQKRQKSLARKYLPLYQIFLDRIKQDDIEIPESKKQEATQRLLSVKNFAESIL